MSCDWPFLLLAFNAPVISVFFLWEAVFVRLLHSLVLRRLLACEMVSGWPCPLVVVQTESNTGIPCCCITTATGIGLFSLPSVNVCEWSFLGDPLPLVLPTPGKILLLVETREPLHPIVEAG